MIDRLYDIVLLLLNGKTAGNLAFQSVKRDCYLVALIGFCFGHNTVNTVAVELSRGVRFVHTDGLGVRRCVVVEFASVQNIILTFVVEERQFHTYGKRDLAFIHHIQQFGYEVGQADIALYGFVAFTRLFANLCGSAVIV